MDNIFKCQRCERVFKRKWDMKRHLSRKNPCMAKTENIPENGIRTIFKSSIKGLKELLNSKNARYFING